jgi:hypothetical protein
LTLLSHLHCRAAVGVGTTVFLLFNAVGLMQVVPSNRTASFDFNGSYAVWAQGGGSCLYAVYDVYVKRAELKQALLGYPDKARGVEFLVNKDTPAKCVVIFDKAAAKAGFSHSRARLVTSRDRAALHP